MGGPGGIVAGLLLLAILAVLLLFFVIGVVLLLVAWARKSRTLTWVGGVFAGLPIAVIGCGVLWAHFSADPDTLELDLTQAISEESLRGERFPGFPAYDYDSDRVDLTLAGGDRFRTPVDKTSVWVRDGRVKSVRLRRDETTLPGLRHRVESWCESLGLPTDGLDAATEGWRGEPGQDWGVERGGRRVSFDMTSTGHAIVWAEIGVPDRGAVGEASSDVTGATAQQLP